MYVSFSFLDSILLRLHSLDSCSFYPWANEGRTGPGQLSSWSSGEWTWVGIFLKHLAAHLLKFARAPDPRLGVEGDGHGVRRTLRRRTRKGPCIRCFPFFLVQFFKMVKRSCRPTNRGGSSRDTRQERLAISFTVQVSLKVTAWRGRCAVAVLQTVRGFVSTLFGAHGPGDMWVNHAQVEHRVFASPPKLGSPARALVAPVRGSKAPPDERGWPKTPRAWQPDVHRNFAHTVSRGQFCRRGPTASWRSFSFLRTEGSWQQSTRWWSPRLWAVGRGR